MNTIQRYKLSNISMTTGGEKKITQVILDGEVRRWVGFGWVNEGKPTAEQLEKLPVVV